MCFCPEATNSTVIPCSPTSINVTSLPRRVFVKSIKCPRRSALRWTSTRHADSPRYCRSCDVNSIRPPLCFAIPGIRGSIHHRRENAKASLIFLMPEESRGFSLHRTTVVLCSATTIAYIAAQSRQTSPDRLLPPLAKEWKGIKSPTCYSDVQHGGEILGLNFIRCKRR